MIELAFLTLIVLLAVGAPLALALAASALAYYATSPMPTDLVMQRLVTGIDSFPMVAIPLFILVGTLMAEGGIARHLMGFADGMVGHRRGGLAQVNVMNSVMMGGMSGSAIADGAVDAKVLVPVMVKNGYSLTFSSALSAATGVIAPMLPPGIGLIVYGLVAQVSVGRLFLGGVVPGLLLALALSVTVAIISHRRGFIASHPKRLPLTQLTKRFGLAVPALLMPVLLIGGLRMGVFTPTELAGIAAVYAFVVGFAVYRQFKLRELPAILLEAAHASAAVMLILMAGSAFAAVITLEQIPQSVASVFLGITTNKVLFLLIITVLLLVLGMFIDGLTLLVLITPMLSHAASVFGVDPIHFGVMMVLLLTIGGITPPLGIVVFTVVQITKANLMATFKEVMPFFGACVAVSLIVVYVPATVTWLPNMMMGS